MNTLIAVAIAPFGIGDELAPEIAEVVKDAIFVLAEKGIRTEVVLKADIRPGYTGMIDSKISKVDEILGGTGVDE